MSIEWNEVDERYTDLRSEEVSFADTLYGFDCPECGQELYNEDADMDPDGPRWYYVCHECDKQFSMSVSKVVIDGYTE
jgi:transcription elongation factor Elf1